MNGAFDWTWLLSTPELGREMLAVAPADAHPTVGVLSDAMEPVPLLVHRSWDRPDAGGADSCRWSRYAVAEYARAPRERERRHGPNEVSAFRRR